MAGEQVAMKVMTFRMTRDLADQVEAVARAEGRTVADAIRVALEEAIEKRRKDPEFQRRLRERMKEDQAVLKRLAKC